MTVRLMQDTSKLSNLETKSRCLHDECFKARMLFTMIPSTCLLAIDTAMIATPFAYDSPLFPETARASTFKFDESIHKAIFGRGDFALNC
jgi:hypothetical protein